MLLSPLDPHCEPQKSSTKLIFYIAPKSKEVNTHAFDPEKQLKADTHERLEDLGLRMADEKLRALAHRVDLQSDQAFEQFSSLYSDLKGNPKAHGDKLKNIVFQGGNESGKLFRTEITARIVDFLNQKLAAKDISEDHASQILEIGLTHWKHKGGTEKALFQGMRMIHYGSDLPEAWKNRFNGKNNRTRLAKNMQNSGQELRLGETVTIGGKTKNIDRVEVLTGAAMAEFPPALTSSFIIENAIPAGPNHLIAQMKNGCEGNLVIVTLKKGTTAKPPAGSTKSKADDLSKKPIWTPTPAKDLTEPAVIVDELVSPEKAGELRADLTAERVAEINPKLHPLEQTINNLMLSYLDPKAAIKIDASNIDEARTKIAGVRILLNAHNEAHPEETMDETDLKKLEAWLEKTEITLDIKSGLADFNPNFSINPSSLSNSASVLKHKQSLQTAYSKMLAIQKDIKQLEALGGHLEPEILELFHQNQALLLAVQSILGQDSLNNNPGKTIDIDNRNFESDLILALPEKTPEQQDLKQEQLANLLVRLSTTLEAAPPVEKTDLQALVRLTRAQLARLSRISTGPTAPKDPLMLELEATLLTLGNDKAKENVQTRIDTLATLAKTPITSKEVRPLARQTNREKVMLQESIDYLKSKGLDTTTLQNELDGITVSPPSTEETLERLLFSSGPYDTADTTSALTQSQDWLEAAPGLSGADNLSVSALGALENRILGIPAAENKIYQLLRNQKAWEIAENPLMKKLYDGQAVEFKGVSPNISIAERDQKGSEVTQIYKGLSKAENPHTYLTALYKPTTRRAEIITRKNRGEAVTANSHFTRVGPKQERIYTTTNRTSVESFLLKHFTPKDRLGSAGLSAGIHPNQTAILQAALKQIEFTFPNGDRLTRLSQIIPANTEINSDDHQVVDYMPVYESGEMKPQYRSQSLLTFLLDDRFIAGDLIAPKEAPDAAFRKKNVERLTENKANERLNSILETTGPNFPYTREQLLLATDGDPLLAETAAIVWKRESGSGGKWDKAEEVFKSIDGAFATKFVKTVGPFQFQLKQALKPKIREKVRVKIKRIGAAVPSKSLALLRDFTSRVSTTDTEVSSKFDDEIRAVLEDDFLALLFATTLTEIDEESVNKAMENILGVDPREDLETKQRLLTQSYNRGLSTAKNIEGLNRSLLIAECLGLISTENGDFQSATFWEIDAKLGRGQFKGSTRETTPVLKRISKTTNDLITQSVRIALRDKTTLGKALSADGITMETLDKIESMKNPFSDSLKVDNRSQLVDPEFNNLMISLSKHLGVNIDYTYEQLNQGGNHRARLFSNYYLDGKYSNLESAV